MTKLLFCTLSSFLLNFCFAQSGLLDPTFGNRGIVATGLGAPYQYDSYTKQVLVQTDGSIYINLYGSFTGTSISRRLPNGAIDSGFGTNGYSRSLIPFTESFAAFQPGGKIVIAGSNESLGLFGITRINVDGTPDSSFGANGIRYISFIPRAIITQTDGKILVAGGSPGENFAVGRFNADGSPDNTFNGSGLNVFDFIYKIPPQFPGEDSTEGHSGTANAIALQADGKILVGGSTYTEEAGNHFAVARLTLNGTIDSSFDGDGRQTILPGTSNATAYSMAVQTDGKIVLAGYTSGAGNYEFAVARFNENGTPDSSFNNDGVQTPGLSSDMLIGNTVAIQSTGKILIAGYTINGGINDFALARLNINGDLDNSFDGDGLLITDINSSDDYAGSVAVQSDDKILVAGYAFAAGVPSFTLVRYNSDGTADNSFDNDGKLTSGYQQGSTQFRATAAQRDGKTVSVGRTWNGSDYDFAVVRYNLNGSLDNSFSDDGRQITDFVGGDEANSVAIQADGKIVVAGNNNSQFAMARYNADGSLDNTFSGDGKLVSAVGFFDIGQSVALQADGKIILAGYSFADPNFDSVFFAVTRFNGNGTPDNTFSSDGKQLTNFEGAASFGASVAVQADGKIVVGGRANINGQNNFAIARYNTDGNLDNSFSTDGKQYNVFGSDDYFAQSITIQNDQKIVVGGYSQTLDGAGSFALARYNANGELDNSFNGSGYQSTSVGPGFNSAVSVAINFDGRIALGGTNGNYVIALYRNNGVPDSAFGNNGLVTTRIGVGESSVQCLVFSLNKLYAVGHGQFPGDFGVVARYLLGAESGPLPVTLVDFTATEQNGTVLLQWKTETEQDLSGFIIERSKDGNTFSSIGHVTAKANTNTKTHYSLIDHQPLNGINYYRLKMADKDGDFFYSKIEIVSLNGGLFSWKVFPNPATDVLMVNAAGENGKATFQVIDALGRKVQEVKVALNGNSSFPIYVRSLSKGVYSLQLKTQTRTETRRFVKQ